MAQKKKAAAKKTTPRKTAAKRAPKKPKSTLVTHAYYRWDEIRKYVEGVLGYDLRDTLGKFKSGGARQEYRDFWHWFVETFDPQDGEVVTFTPGFYLDEPEVAFMVPAWVREILHAFRDAFGDEFDVKVEW